MPDIHAALEARSLSYALGGRPLLSDIHLRLPAGRVSALLGPNGAGKTTLLRLLAGLQPPSAGEARVAGRAAHALAPRERASLIAWVPQHLPGDVPLTVAEFAGLGRIPHLGAFGQPSAADRQAVAQALDAVELVPKAGMRLAALSGGERQRAAIARALAQSAPVILLDEPTNHLDLRHQHRLQLLLHALADAGHTVVQVLHDLALAAEYAHHVALLDRGRLIASGEPAMTLTPECLQDVYQWPVHLRHHRQPVTAQEA